MLSNRRGGLHGREIMMNRKLIRPRLAELKSRASNKTLKGELATLTAAGRKQVPPEQTNAENFYYLKQMAGKTPMVVVLDDGEKLRGVIEWYDRDCIKVNRIREPNMLVMKRHIKYMYKERERRG